MEAHERSPDPHDEIRLRAQMLADGVLIELGRKQTLDDVVCIPEIRQETEELLVWGTQQENTDSLEVFTNLAYHEQNELLKMFLSRLIVGRYDQLSGSDKA